jgi:hypothetical protein
VLARGALLNSQQQPHHACAEGACCNIIGSMLRRQLVGNGRGWPSGSPATSPRRGLQACCCIEREVTYCCIADLRALHHTRGPAAIEQLQQLAVGNPGSR